MIHLSNGIRNLTIKFPFNQVIWTPCSQYLPQAPCNFIGIELHSCYTSQEPGPLQPKDNPTIPVVIYNGTDCP